MAKRNEETVRLARELSASGMTVKAVARQLRVSWHTAKTMIDPEAYAEHKRKAMEWTANNPDKAAKSRRAYNRRPEIAEARNSALRTRYATDLDYRAQRDAWTVQQAQGVQERLRQAVRGMIWAIASGGLIPWKSFAVACVGVPIGVMQARLSDPGSCDHIVPLCRFDLTDSVQLRQAVHWSNVRRIPLLENIARPDTMPEGVTVAGLPYVETDEAAFQAGNVIRRVSARG